MKKEMDVGIDESGEKSAIPQVNYFRSDRALDCVAHLDDVVTEHKNFAGLRDVAGLDIEQACCVQNDGMRLRLHRPGLRRLRLAHGIDSQRQPNEKCSERESAHSHIARDGITASCRVPGRSLAQLLSS